VFTAEDTERDSFLDLITAPRPAMKVVLAVRADQYERCAAYPRLARLLAADQVLVGPIGRDEVAAIARHPAERVGLRVEPELVEALIADLGTEPGAMPLLSTALLELWEAREDGRLTLAAYRATGGVQGAVARLAESAYARLDPEEQESARSLFMRLVGEGSEPETIVRRRLSMAELETIGDPRVGDVIEKLTVGRLLTRDEGTVEVAHEALIREWPRLREWIEADAAGRQLRLHLIEAAQAWNAGGRGDEDLYRAARLAAALEWSVEHEAELNAVERDFLEASRASAAQAAERQRRTNRILRGLLAGAGVLLLLAVGAGAVAWIQAGQNAENASNAQVRELSLSALTVANGDPELGLLLAAEAVTISQEAGRTPPAQALQALWTAYVAGKSTTTVPGVGSQVVAYSPDGTRLVVDAPERDDALVTIRDPSTGEEVDAVPETGEAAAVVESIAFSPDGRWMAVATSGPPGAGAGSVEVFEAPGLEPVHRLSSGHDGYRGVSLTDEGLVAASGVTEGVLEVVVVVWELTTGAERANIATVPGILNSDLRYLGPYTAAFRPTDGVLVVGARSGFDTGSQGFLAGLNLTEEVLRCPPCPEKRPAWMKAIDFVPDLVVPSPLDDRVAVGDVGRGRVAVIEPLLGVPVFDPVGYRNLRSLAWNAEGTRLAVSGGEDAVVLDATAGTALVTLPSRGESLQSAAFRAESDEISVVSSAGRLRIHRTTATGGDLTTTVHSLVGPGDRMTTGRDPTTTGGSPVDLGVTEEHVVVSLAGIGIAVYDRASGAELHSRDLEVDARLHGQVAKDAGQVAGIYDNGQAAFIEAATLSETARLPGCAAPTGTSPDGRYVVLHRVLGIADDNCGGADVIAGVVDVANSEPVIEYELERLQHGAISNPTGSDGPRYAAIAVYEDESGPGRLDIWEVDSAALVASVDEEARPGFLPAYVSFSPDARYLAIGTNGPRAVVIDVASLAEGSDLDAAIVFDREVHTSRSAKVVLTDDGVLATSSGDGVYRFWSLETGEMTMQLETFGLAGSGSFDFSPDFESFYYEDGGGVIRRMPVDVDEMIDLATSSTNRSLTDAECREYLHTDGCAAP
jgi:WD40 repeat protein